MHNSRSHYLEGRIREREKEGSFEGNNIHLNLPARREGVDGERKVRGWEEVVG